jgi:hypothetical protein
LFINSSNEGVRTRENKLFVCGCFREGCLGGVGVVDGLNVNGVAGYCGWRRKRVTKLRKLSSPACKGNVTAVGRERNIEQWRGFQI